MIKSVYSKYINEQMTLWMLIFITVISWFMYPLMLKQFNPMIFHIGFATCWALVATVVVITSTRNQIALPPLHKIMLVCWIGYLLALLLSTLASASMYSLAQWCILAAKFLFFAFLLAYMNAKFIVVALRVYANLMVATVCFALIAVVLVAIGVQPFTTMDVGGKLGDVYFGAYYVHNPNDLICLPTSIFGIESLNSIFRIQGLSEEPGTYAFALLPAFFWLLIADKAYVRSAVIVLGLMFSFSIGAGLLLLMLLPIMARKYSANNKVPAFFFGALCLIGLMQVVSNSCVGMQLSKINDVPVATMTAVSFTSSASPKHADSHMPISKISYIHFTPDENQTKLHKKIDLRSSLTDAPPSVAQLAITENTDAVAIASKNESKDASSNVKVRSFQDRINGLLAVYNYFKSHVIGTGTALGMLTVNNSISVGYAVAFLEAGIVGGILYLCLFAVMGWLALKIIIAPNHDSFDERVRTVISLSVCTVLFMGTQRMQPDLSLWHMWIYAMWFYLLQNKLDTESAHV